MKENDIKEKLKNRSANAVVPDVLNEVKKADLSLYRTDDPAVVPQAQAVLQRKRPAWITAAAAAVLLFALGLGLLQAFSFDKRVYATVNMSIGGSANYSIELNKKSQVIDITPDNYAGSAVLQTLTYKKKDLMESLTEVLIACVDYGFLTEDRIDGGEIVFFINCDDGDKTQSLKECVELCVSAAKAHCEHIARGGNR